MKYVHCILLGLFSVATSGGIVGLSSSTTKTAASTTKTAASTIDVKTFEHDFEEFLRCVSSLKSKVIPFDCAKKLFESAHKLPEHDAKNQGPCEAIYAVSLGLNDAAHALPPGQDISELGPLLERIDAEVCPFYFVKKKEPCDPAHRNFCLSYHIFYNYGDLIDLSNCLRPFDHKSNPCGVETCEFYKRILSMCEHVAGGEPVCLVSGFLEDKYCNGEHSTSSTTTPKTTGTKSKLQSSSHTSTGTLEPKRTTSTTSLEHQSYTLP